MPRFIKGDRVFHRKFGNSTVEEAHQHLHPALSDDYVFIRPDSLEKGCSYIVMVDADRLSPVKE